MRRPSRCLHQINQCQCCRSAPDYQTHQWSRAIERGFLARLVLDDLNGSLGYPRIFVSCLPHAPSWNLLGCPEKDIASKCQRVVHRPQPTTFVGINHGHCFHARRRSSLNAHLLGVNVLRGRDYDEYSQPSRTRNLPAHDRTNRGGALPISLIQLACGADCGQW